MYSTSEKCLRKSILRKYSNGFTYIDSVLMKAEFVLGVGIDKSF